MSVRRPLLQISLDLLSVSHANWGILQTLASNAQTRHATGLANTLLLLPPGTCYF
jgi:hypothetical protein